MTGTALLTDRYELTMLQAALRSGAAHRHSVFEVFARRLPDGRRYGVVAGTGRLPGAVQRFRFDDADLAHLSDHHVVDDSTLEWLREYRFSGCISGYAEGECYLPNSPVLAVEGSFAEAVLLETLVLSVLNHDSAVAAAASRMTAAAEGRPCIEMGSRRTHEEAAVAAARAAYVAGFGSTSNLEAGRRYGVPTSGTSAHAFTLLHDDERAAFEAQVASQGAGTTLLVDTYDVEAAVRLAVEVAGRDLGAVRLDSGDLLAQARQVREQLDALGNPGTRIIVTSDLDEFAIAALAAAPVDGYGVGTQLVIGSGAPTAGMVYKLVARENAAGELEGVAKRSAAKAGVGGRKHAGRLVVDGVAQAEVLRPWPREVEGERPLQVELVRDGEVVHREPLDAARDRHRASLAELPPSARQLSRGEPAIPTRYEQETP
ncbi:nicotinate phosphoribosyltransferase [Angustibacter aerolatus]